MKNIEISKKFSVLSEKINTSDNKKKKIDLTEGNPTKFIKSKEKKIKIEKSKIFTYDPNPKGLKIVRQIIKKYYKNKNRKINIDDLFLTTGTSESISYLLKMFCNKGDIILLPSPGYPIFEYISGFEEIEYDYYKLIYNKIGTWEIDFEYLKKNINERVKILILVNPNNPTGSALSKDQLLELEEFLLKYNVLLIIDEVFIDYNHISIKNFEFNFNIPCIYINGISKSYGLPGFKIAWILFSGSHEFKEKIKPYLEIICDTYLSVSTPSQILVKNLLNKEVSRQKYIKKIIRLNLKEIKKITNSGNSLNPIVIDFGWYLPIKVVTPISIDAFTEYLCKEMNVKVYSGKLFNFDEEKIIVISLLNHKKTIRKGFKRIYKFISSI